MTSFLIGLLTFFTGVEDFLAGVTAFLGGEIFFLAEGFYIIEDLFSRLWAIGTASQISDYTLGLAVCFLTTEAGFEEALTGLAFLTGVSAFLAELFLAGETLCLFGVGRFGDALFTGEFDF